MISDASLDLAVAQGHITADQAGKLRAIEAAARGAPADSPDDEKLRFVTGFADIFVTIGIGLFVGASAYFIQEHFGVTAMWGGCAILSWLLAEFFTRRRRLALPSIVLLVVFVFAAFRASVFLFAQASGAHAPGPFAPFDTDGGGLGLEMAAVATAALAALHYWRFRVPITIAAGAAALCLVPIDLAAAYLPGRGAAVILVVTLVCGLLVFALAMRFDLSDPERVTRRTDIAFWLHLLAAPLIVHSLIGGLVGAHGLNEPDMGRAAAILSIILALGLVALVIDRRAILVSGLTYAGFAFGAIIRQTGFGGAVAPATLLALGAFVLLLSAFWTPLRRAVLGLIPLRFARRLPRPLPMSS